MTVTTPDIPDNAFSGGSGITEGTGADGVGDLAQILQAVKTDLDAHDLSIDALAAAVAAIPYPTLKASAVVSTAEILDLHNTAKELVPAPAGGFYNDFVSATIRAVFNTTALDATAALGDLRFKKAGGQELAIQEADAFLDAGASTVRAVKPSASAAAQDATPTNDAIQLDNDGAAFTAGGGGDTTLTIDVYYRELPL